MTNLVVRSPLWFSAISSGLLARVYFAFSTLDGARAHRAGTRCLRHELDQFDDSAIAVHAALLRHDGSKRGARDHRPIMRSEPSATAMLVGGLTYIAGMSLCTAFRNGPLNNALAAVDPASGGAAPL